MPEPLIRLFEDSKSPAKCRGCDAKIEWFDTLNGRKMPMNAGAVSRKSENDPETRRIICSPTVSLTVVSRSSKRVATAFQASVSRWSNASPWELPT
jgi:hypothetical protein